jgi:RND family efflux transporter MFP subunit
VSMHPAAKRISNLPTASALIACAALALLSGCQRGQDEDAVEIRPVRAITVADRASSGSVSLTGKVQAQSEINQSFRIGGRVIERLADVGDKVKPGQLMARLDPQNEESSLQSARAQRAAAGAQLVEAQNNHTRMRDLVAEDAVPRASFDQAVALLKTAQAQVESAQSQVSLAENRLSYTRLVSEVAGVVTERGAEPGEVVNAGSMIIQVARESARDAVFGVPAQIKNSAPTNADITVALTSDPTTTVVGRVREMSPRADPVTGTFAVRVALPPDAPAAMRLGSTVTGSMQFDATIGIEIPASALVRTEGKSAVWIVDPAALTVSMRTIEVQAQDPDNIQVGSGLNPGDVVVTAGVHALRPGQKVRLLDATQS